MTGGRADGPPAIAFVTDRHATLGRPIPEVAAAAAAGGATLVQVREKDLLAAELLKLVTAVMESCRSAGAASARVVVNDRLDVALAARAAGVHLPATGIDVAAVLRAAPKRFLVGRSVHALAEAKDAAKAGADYLFFGPIFATPGKAAFGPPQGVEALKRVVEGVRVPVWAIGGITPVTAPNLRSIPIAGVAAVAAIAAASDPAEAVRALRAALR